ncbi:hypothetical protein PsorP6_009725 [Peronosclerospora sorghi]|uniref:Uncharacterized protein n=1 Tax=Peronosclerospora sorghi TaxID=230839 RepID=A0ACC0W030_9STRA|nr:hypothetical protein PsorP6_009725 [Peronosclerospora sorghi]
MPRLEAQESRNLSPTKSLLTTVCQHLSMDLSGRKGVESECVSPTDSSSEPSPHGAVTNRQSLCETKQAASPPGPLYINPLKQDHPQKKAETNPNVDFVASLTQTLLRDSTGSIAITTRQQGALDLRRHTFSTMSADSRANMRRRSYDMTAPFGSTFPPSSPPHQSLLQSFNPHLHHLRMYGKHVGPAKRLGQGQEEGPPLLTFIVPNHGTVWTRGKPVDVKWEVVDTKVEKVRIELLEEGRTATTLIALEAPNTGFFTYAKVPWGMESGSKYFLRVSAAEASTDRYRTSSFFQISSSP